MAQRVKNLPAIRETQVQSLDWEDLLEKGMAIHSSIFAWRIPWTGTWWATVHGVAEWPHTTEWVTLSSHCSHDQSLMISQLSQSQILILMRPYKVPHDVPPWPLCLIPFHSPSLTSSAPATLVLGSAQTHQAHFQQPLLKASLLQRVSLTSTSSHIPITLFLQNTYHHLAWGFPDFIVYQPLIKHIILLIFFSAALLHQEICFMGGKA